MSKVRIAFFLEVMQEDFDGVAITMHQIIRHIPKDKIDAIFITPQPPQKDIGFPVHVCKYFVLPEKGKEYRVGLPGRTKGLDELLDSFQPQLVHFSSPTFMGWYAYRYAKKHEIPVTSIYHTHYDGFMDYYFKKFPFLIKPSKWIISKFYELYKGCDRVFAPTASMKEFLMAYGVDESRIAIWGRGVNADRFNPNSRDEGFWNELPTENKKILFVSRLVKEKEPETLIRLHGLLGKRRDLSLIIVGDGPTREELESKMPDAYFAGSLFGDDLAKAYSSSDLFVFPSTTETFGNVVLEALASGLPVIAADAGGPGDIVKHQQTGELVEPQNEQAFYDAIVRFADDKTYYQQCREHAVAYAKSQSWEMLCENLFENYFTLTR